MKRTRGTFAMMTQLATLLAASLINVGLAGSARGEEKPPVAVLAIGADAPDFCLPGIDGLYFTRRPWWRRGFTSPAFQLA